MRSNSWGIGLLVAVATGLVGCPTGGDPPPRTDSGVRTDGGGPGVDGGGSTCGTGRTSCDGVCVNTDSDVENCGSCGNDCGATEECNDGTCETVSCTGGLTACGAGCTNTDTDRTNCGACGTACAATEVCTAGDCVPSCAAPSMLCTEDPGDGSTVMVCRMTETDPANCGACGTACNGDQTCVAGDCTCAAGRMDCGGTCVNTDGDPANCGACGTVCNADQNCVGGDCICPAGRDACGSPAVCVNTDVDNNNCGSCGNVCGAGTACGAGTCTSVCAGSPGTTPCGSPSMCVNTATDRNNCGGCGIVCATNAACSGSICRPMNDLRTGAISFPVTTAAQTTITGSNANGTSDTLANACGCSNNHSIWYSFTLTASEVVYFDTLDTMDLDMSLSIANSTGVLATNPNTGTGSFCNDDAGCGTTTAETRRAQIAGQLGAGTYYLVVDSCGAGGNFTVNFQHFPRSAVTFLYSAPLTASGSRVDTLSTGSTRVPACTGVGASGEDANWFTTCSASALQTFSLCAPDGGSWTRGLITTAADPELSVWSGTTATEVQCNDDGGFGCGATDAASSEYGPRLANVTVGRGLNVIIVDERNRTGGMPYTLFYRVSR